MSRFLSNDVRSFLTAAGLGILLNFLVSFWSGNIFDFGVRIQEILFVSIGILGFVGIFIAVIYNVIYESKFSWLGWCLGAIASVFLSYVFPGYMYVYISGYPQLAIIAPLIISTLLFYFAIRNHKHSGITHVKNLINEARIRKSEGDIYEAIRCYVKSALAARSHPNSKIARTSIESYENLAVELATVSILTSDANKIIPFLKDCQKKLKRVETYKEKTLKVDKILESFTSESNIHLIFRMFLDTDDSKSFINKLLGRARAVKLSALASEYNYDEKMLRVFLETAVANGKIEGFLTTDKKIFMTSDFLREQLYNTLTN